MMDYDFLSSSPLGIKGEVVRPPSFQREGEGDTFVASVAAIYFIFSELCFCSINFGNPKLMRNTSNATGDFCKMRD